MKNKINTSQQKREINNRSNENTQKHNAKRESCTQLKKSRRDDGRMSTTVGSKKK